MIERADRQNVDGRFFAPRDKPLCKAIKRNESIVDKRAVARAGSAIRMESGRRRDCEVE